MMSVAVNSPLTIDSTFKAMQHWRSNKKSYDCRGIPEDIWEMIFRLEGDGCTVNELRRVFGLNSVQFKKKHAEFKAKSNTQCQAQLVECDNDINEVPAIQFSEAIVVNKAAPIPSLSQAAEKTKLAVKKIKSTNNKPESYLDVTTVVVECIRPDGHRLKIHTTQGYLDVLMQSFFSQEVVSI